METRVKERLVGAVILVALIVALVPEILSGPHKPEAATGSADAEQPLHTYTIDLEERGFPDSSTESSPAAPDPQPTPPEVAAPPASQDQPDDTSAATTVTPAPEQPAVAQEAPTEPPSAEPASTSGWAVQLGSFSNAENAERLARELRRRGYEAYVSPYESAGQKRMRVRIGPEEDRTRAEQLAQRLRREGRQATVVAQP